MNEKIPLKNVLIIDDDDITNYLTQEIFEEVGVKSKLIFKTMAEDALNYIQDDNNEFPDLILLDINMPKLTGWDFLDRYEKLGYHHKRPTLIVMLSTSIYEKDKKKARTYKKVVDYFVKPLTEESLSAFLERYYILSK